MFIVQSEGSVHVKLVYDDAIVILSEQIGHEFMIKVNVWEEQIIEGVLLSPNM